MLNVILGLLIFLVLEFLYLFYNIIKIKAVLYVVGEEMYKWLKENNKDKKADSNER